MGLSTLFKASGCWWSFGDHTRSVEEQRRSSGGAVEEPRRSSGGAAEPPPLSTILRSTQSKQAGHKWSLPCDCPLCAKCGRALQLLFFKVTSGWDGLSSIKDLTRSCCLVLHGVTDTIFNYFSFNSSADLLCIISSKLTLVKLHFQR